MTNSITPPPELVGQWQDESPETQIADHIQYLATRAAQWGADMELEACCEWLENQTLCGHRELIPSLRRLRRPKPPSLKEQALEQLACIQTDLNKFGMGISTNTIRRALEALDD
jgi:hypothetical protein